MEKKPKLVAFDLDGTLAESKQPMEPHMGELIAKLLEQGSVAVMSGASFAQFEKQFLPTLPKGAQIERHYLFPNNAARCYVFKDAVWCPHYDHSFDAHARDHVVQALKEALAEVGMSEEPAQLWGERIEDRGAQISFSPLGQQAPVPEKKEWNRAYNDLRKLLHATLVKKLPDFSVKMGGMTTIDITHSGINKAYGVRQLSKLTGIPISEMLYIGDALEEGGNDAVVIETGIRTKQVAGPEDTARLITSLLQL